MSEYKNMNAKELIVFFMAAVCLVLMVVGLVGIVYCMFTASTATGVVSGVALLLGFSGLLAINCNGLLD